MPRDIPMGERQAMKLRASQTTAYTVPRHGANAKLRALNPTSEHADGPRGTGQLGTDRVLQIPACLPPRSGDWAVGLRLSPNFRAPSPSATQSPNASKPPSS
jgi:hypothetical protein